MIADYIEISHQGTGPFVNVHMNRQLVRLPLIVIVHFSLDLHLAEAVRFVERLQHGHVPFQQDSAITPMGKKAGGRQDLHPRQ